MTEPIKSAHAALLNRLSEMQEAPYYATARGTLAQAEQAIVELERTAAAPRGTDAQILKERELTATAISGAIWFGCQGTNPPPAADHWLAPFWEIGKRQARACEIADDAMFELLESEGVPQDEHRTVIGLTDEACQEVSTLAEASTAMREAFEWLQPRGYVELGKDDSGEFINVIRRPGED